ncbi:hypothetical protein DICPUDRAFT_97317 [Dictyostelium purpureum]|uniref:Pesticidal crystal protein N-terminal domain-containing protein n=1 Tax=Dictyostelium purpureum TaxID=5786 RepID=F0ZFN0_DICPU|nr:uncharacterized protein DICPUDRAFT_97317 [Dictyostelium purpureum]EGC37240.1 hypothetical protein DICPUDRAFT_97317 [Dictyostelium purpureum]|eukprot:XP_003286210.1 hypothetical protein DICPUDRAFT_97317 [Dictyostelium purpureum]
MSDSVIVEGEAKTFNLQELNDEIIQKYTEQPLLVIVPFGFTGSKQGTYSPVNDQLDLGMEKYKPCLEDLEILTCSLIGCIPTVGPLCQGVFTSFVGLFKEKQLSAEDIKKMTDEKLGKLKEELLVTIDEKIEKAKIENYKKICQNSFIGFSQSSLELLMDDLSILRKKLEKKKTPKKTFMDGLRQKFDLFRINIKSLFPLFEEKKYLEYIYKQYLDLIFLYIMCMQNLMNFWYQYQFDACYARGTPAIPEYNIKATHSYREKLHINIQRFLQSLQDGLITNKPGLEKASIILECDPILYPVPLLKANSSDYSDGNILINVKQRRVPFIFRIDGACCSGSNDTNISDEVDSLTGCKGVYLKVGPKFNVKLSEPKYVRVRLFIANDKSNSPNLNLSSNNSIGEHNWNKIEDEFGSLQSTKSEKKCVYTSGFVQSKKSKTKESELNFTILDKTQNNNNKLLFIEVIVSDS